MTRSEFDLVSHLDERSSFRLRHRRMSLVQGASICRRSYLLPVAFVELDDDIESFDGITVIGIGSKAFNGESYRVTGLKAL